MSGPSLFDDFFSDPEEQDHLQNATDPKEILPQSITSIKQLLKEHYEKEANPELPQEEYTYHAEEESESYKSIQKEEENAVSDSESRHILNSPQEKSFFEIEWSPAVPEFELDITQQKAYLNKPKETSFSEENLDHSHKQPTDSSLTPPKTGSVEAYFEVEWPDHEHSLINHPEPFPEVEEKYSLQSSALEMLEAHIDTPGLELEDTLHPHGLAEEELNVKEMLPTEGASIKEQSSFDLNEVGLEDTLEETSPVPIPQHISESALPDWKLEDKYYPIGEVAKLFEVNLSHIRYWTNEFKLKPRTTRRGERLYNLSDIQKLRMIYFLVKEQKHTIQGAKKHLRNNASAVVDQIELKASLLSFRQSLEAILNILD